MELCGVIEKKIELLLNDKLEGIINGTEINKLKDSLSAEVIDYLTPEKLLLQDLDNQKQANAQRAVVSVIGQDSVGIVADVTAKLAEHQVNIDGMNQTVLRGFFAFILTVDLTNLDLSLVELQQEMNVVAEKHQLKIYLQHENIFSAINRI